MNIVLHALFCGVFYVNSQDLYLLIYFRHYLTTSSFAKPRPQDNGYTQSFLQVTYKGTVFYPFSSEITSFSEFAKLAFSFLRLFILLNLCTFCFQLSMRTKVAFVTGETINCEPESW